MENNSLILSSLNKIFAYSQNKCSYLWENSLFLKNIDRIIFATIIGVFVLSTFASSDLIGYVGFITLFLTIIKLFVKKGERAELNLFEFFLLLYFLIVVISLAGSSLFYLSFKGFLKTFMYLGFYFSAVQYFKNNLSKIPLTIFVIALCAASQGIAGIFQNFSQVGEISTWQDISSINPEDVMTRVYGTLQPYNPNLFGGYLVAALPCLFGSFILRILDKKYYLAGGALILALLTSFTLILSGCRGAYIGLMAIMLCFLAFLAKFIWDNGQEIFKKIYLSVLGSIVAFSTCVVLFVSSIRTRIFSIFSMRDDSSTSFRFNVYQSAINMVKDNWVLGIGIGNQNFREIYGLYMRTGFDALSAYCVFLEISVESGVFALLAFLAFLTTLGYKAVKFILAGRDLKLSVIVAISIISVVAVMVHGLVDTIFFRPQVQFIFWTMVAFISAILNPENYNSRESENG
ncbi:MAG: O-antigen ligase family protein [Candidatus Gastranaerophilaceae bacterium]